MLGRRGTMSLVGLPAGDFPLPIFDVVLSRKTIRGSIVGTRQDLAEAIDFAARGLVTPHYTMDKLENINEIFARMEDGTIDGRVVLDLENA
jgi:propanol-preferring alcohol dehydrogenase